MEAAGVKHEKGVRRDGGQAAAALQRTRNMLVEAPTITLCLRVST